MEKQFTTKQDYPYEKFMRFGPGNLTEKELLAIILRTGTKERNVLELAGEVLALARYPREGLLGLYDVSLEELRSLRGIGAVKAIQLKCIAELSMRISIQRAREGLSFQSSLAVAKYFMEKLRHRERECVILVCLDAKCRLLRETQLSEGSVRMSLISPREIFLEALDCKAVHILLVHNHPSGDPAPSAADKELTANIKELGDKMDISLLDHIIIGDNRYTSFKEEALL